MNHQILTLLNLSTKELKTSWKKVFNTDPPTTISQSLLLRSIAYRYQEREGKKLSSDSLHLLKKYQHELNTSGDIKSLIPTIIKPGTRLLRTWKEPHHEVIVLPDNQYMWQGETYASLSKIAREITGTRRNGPAFFGLREST